MKKVMMVGVLLLFVVKVEATQSVWIVAKSEVYHVTSSCRTLSRSKYVQQVPKSRVPNRRPCKVCS